MADIYTPKIVGGKRNPEEADVYIPGNKVLARNFKTGNIEGSAADLSSRIKSHIGDNDNNTFMHSLIRPQSDISPRHDKFNPGTPPPAGKAKGNMEVPYDMDEIESGKRPRKKLKEMAEPSKLRQVFPKGTKAPTDKKTKSKIGEKGLLGYSLQQNDPETLKYLEKHPITDHGDREDTNVFNVARSTKYCMDDPRNKHMKGHGKEKERDVYEDDQLDEKNWIAGAVKHPGKETALAHKAGMSTQAYMHKHEHDKGASGKRAQLGLRLSKMHHEETVCSKCHKAPCQCGCGSSDKSQNEPAYKKDKKLLMDKKVKEETMANLLAMEILEARKIERLEEAQNLNPYASDKIGGGGMGGGAKPPTRADIFKNFDNRLPQRSIWQKLTGQGPTDAQKATADANRAAAKSGLESYRAAHGRDSQSGSISDTHEPNPVDKGGEYKIGSGTYKSTLNPEGGKKVIGKSIDKIDMGNPKFPKTVKGMRSEAVKLSNIQQTHDTEFTGGMEVHRSAEGESQTTNKPDGPTRSDKSKKLDKRNIKGVKDPANVSFKEGSEAEPVTNQLVELSAAHIRSHYLPKAKKSNEKTTGIKAMTRNDSITTAQAKLGNKVKDWKTGQDKEVKVKATNEDIGAAAGTGSPGDRTTNLKADTTFALEGGKAPKRSPGTEKRMKLNDPIGRRAAHFGQNDEETDAC